MTEKDLSAVQTELASLRARVAQLEAEEAERRAASESNGDWKQGFYLTYYATTGFFLGMVGALASLGFNVVGSLLVNQHPLQIIKVYLTFGLGEKALDPSLDSGVVLALGCCLYIATGMLLGIPFQILLTKYAANDLGKRFVIATGLSLVIWFVNYYVLLSWIQPLLFGGNWIIDPNHLPIGVAVLTHLVFGLTMALLYPLGTYEPYRVRTE